MYSRMKFVIPRKRRNSRAFLGKGIATTASMRLLSDRTPSLETTCPRT